MNRKEKEILRVEKYQIDCFNINDFVTSNHYIGRESDKEILM